MVSKILIRKISSLQKMQKKIYVISFVVHRLDPDHELYDAQLFLYLINYYSSENQIISITFVDLHYFIKEC